MSRQNLLHRSLMTGTSINININLETNYCSFIAMQSGVSISFSSELEYSIDGGEWSVLSANTLSPKLNTNQYISFRAELTPSNTGIGSFTIDGGEVYAAGNCMSLLFKDNAADNYSLEGYPYAFALLLSGTSVIGVTDSFLPATTLSEGCYASMFKASSLKYAMKKLPALETKNYCYHSMFESTNIKEAPELPAVVITKSCYQNMFHKSKLVWAPELPATSVALSCYEDMFFECGSLVEAPSILPATILAERCYLRMFSRCTKLKTTPLLPATVLAPRCYGGLRSVYDGMFSFCVSLEEAPELPATELSEECYAYMFSRCGSLNKSPNLPATKLATHCYKGMFYGCEGITEALELPASTLAVGCYREMFNGCINLTVIPKLPALILAEGCYMDMFMNCISLNEAPSLPATELAKGCYSGMFSGTNILPDCSNIDFTNEQVVNSMGLMGLFEGTKVTYEDLLNILPIDSDGECYLPVLTLSENCYYSMFESCKMLEKAPKLPATTLAKSCYSYMFYGCSSLQESPILPATTLVNRCYDSMFGNCSNIRKITSLNITPLSYNISYMWTYGVPSEGTFIKNVDATWNVRGDYGIPNGWEVEYDLTPTECTNLVITADDVWARGTNTNIYWKATVNGYKTDGTPVEDFVLKGTVTSEEFSQNTSSEDIQRTITFEYLGVTASTTITQSRWIDKGYQVRLNNQWKEVYNIENTDPENFDIFESFSNRYVYGDKAKMYIDIVGYSEFKFFITTSCYAGNYVLASKLDKDIGPNTHYSSPEVNAYKAGIVISSYNKDISLIDTPSTYSELDGEVHTIAVSFTAAGAGQGFDTAFVKIPKNQ